MRRYRRNRISGKMRTALIGVTAAALAGGAFAISTGVSSAGEDCGGLDQALRNNLEFIAGQRANPDALSEARIANRQAVVDLINQRRATAGCKGNVGNVAQPPAQVPAQPAKPPTKAPTQPPAAGNNGGGNNGGGGAGNNGAGNNGGGNNGGAAGEVVCKGSTVTLSGEAGAPAASSGTFPIGTTIKVTNLDNNKSTTVKVASPSGSCILLNDAAFEQVREPGKFLIRRAIIERVG